MESKGGQTLLNAKIRELWEVGTRVAYLSLAPLKG